MGKITNLFACSFISLLAAVPIGASNHEGLIEGAKKEGKLVLYTSMTVDQAQKLNDVFGVKYPFLQVSMFRAVGERLLTKILTEAQAGRYEFDVVQSAETQAYFLKKRNLLGKYLSPEAKNLPKGFFDPQGYWSAIYMMPNVIAYNTRMVKRDKVPRTDEELLNPKWKGKFSLEREETGWFLALMEHWGEEKGKSFFQALGAQIPTIRSGHTLLAQLIIAGEDPMSPNASNHHFPRAQKRGAPADWNNLEPVIGHGIVTGLAKNAPHPHAAMLFIDFLFSKDGGQKMVHEANRIATHPDLLPDPPRLREGFDFILVDPAKYLDKIHHYEKLWREWVLREK